MSSGLTVGIVGGGFVGGAHARALSTYARVLTYDRDESRRTAELADVARADVIFVCLPTPMRRDGSVEDGVVWEALDSLRANLVHSPAVIVKSTLPPSALDRLYEEFWGSLYLIYSCEHLTERTADSDLIQSTRFLLGLPAAELNLDSVQRVAVDHLLEHRWPMVPRLWRDYRAVSLSKYALNSFFATKVSFFNQLYQLCERLGLDGQEVTHLVTLDPRVGRSHNQVPGHDGHLGFGGHCLIKDDIGYSRECELNGVRPTISLAAWKKNLEARGRHVLVSELNSMLGRAVAEELSLEDLQLWLER